VLDPGLALPPGAKLFSAWREAQAQGSSRGAPIVLHGPPPLAADHGGQEEEEAAAAAAAWRARRGALEAAGARLLQVPLLPGSSSHLDLSAALQLLAAQPFALESIMVEGGAGVLASFAAQAASAVASGQRPLLHAVLVTLAPQLLPGGLHISPSFAAGTGSLALSFQGVQQCGKDLLVLAAPFASQDTVTGEGGGEELIKGIVAQH